MPDATLHTIREHLLVMVSLVPQSGPLEIAHLMADDAKRALAIIETLISNQEQSHASPSKVS